MSINVETIGGSLMVQHYVEDISKRDRGIPFESAKQSLAASAPAHNAQETPFFAASIEKKALEAKAAAGT